MIYDLIYSELLKYKRSALPWMVAAGGIMPSIIALLMVIGETAEGNWKTIIPFSFNSMNLMALLLLSVLVGFVFAGEYQESTISVIFTYPISRFYLYMVKLIVVVILAGAVYFIFFVSTLLVGFVYIKEVPSHKLVLEFIKLTATMVLINFSFMPLTIFICNVAKKVIASVMTGMGYIVIYMIFINSDYNLYIPVCIPAEIIKKIYISDNFNSGDIKSIISAVLMIFPIGFLVSAVLYSKSDIMD